MEEEEAAATYSGFAFAFAFALWVDGHPWKNLSHELCFLYIF